MEQYYEQLAEIQKNLAVAGIAVIVYGSIAASFWLGKYKQDFLDFDLLVADSWLTEEWGVFQDTLLNDGYQLTDQHEHEFLSGNRKLGFAPSSILDRDAICKIDELIIVSRGGHDFTTLSPASLLKAYEFSFRDGYRQNERAKKDDLVVVGLRSYIASNTQI